MLHKIPAPISNEDLEYLGTVSYWKKERLEVYLNAHTGMVLFKELKNSQREIIHVTDDETEQYVRNCAHRIVENHYNMYVIEHQNTAVWYECDDTQSITASLAHFVSSSAVEPHQLILDTTLIVGIPEEKEPMSDTAQIQMYEQTWRDLSALLPDTWCINVRNFNWIADIHHQRAVHIVYNRGATDEEEPDKTVIRTMALQFRCDSAMAELEAMRKELARKELLVQHMSNQLLSEVD